MLQPSFRARAFQRELEADSPTPKKGEQVTLLELRVYPEDLGKVSGRRGRTVVSIRTILGAVGMKLKRRFALEILE